MKKTKVIHGEIDGIPYRAHFDGKPSKKQLMALDALVKHIGKMTDEEIENLKHTDSK